MTNFISPVGIGETVYDTNANAWVVYSVQFYDKNIALKCKSPTTGAGKTLLVGKKSIGRTVFVGKNAFEDALAFTKTSSDNRKPDEKFENFKMS